MIGEAGKLNFIVPHDVEAVWHQSGGVVQLFVDGTLHMAMPVEKARELANALLAAARVPDVAQIMAAADEKPVESLRQLIRRESGYSGQQPYPPVVMAKHEVFFPVSVEPVGVIPGSDTDNGFTRWSPETPRNAVLREQYAR